MCERKDPGQEAQSPGVVEAANTLRRALRDFQPELVSGADCEAIVEVLAATENACAAVRARAANRAADCGAHARAGFSSAAEWLARRTGTSAGAARSAMDTMAAVDDKCPLTAKALAAGQVSLLQAEEIAKTEGKCAGSEAELLALARSESLQSLKDNARRRRLGAVDPDTLRRRQHAAREFLNWRDDLGMIRFSGALTPEVGVFINRLDAEADRIFRQGDAEVRAEPRAARAADAFVRLIEGRGKKKAYSADLVIVCNRRAYARGHAHEGEVCHIVGGGPTPVSLAREVSRDAFLKAVIHDGVRIDTVAHFGRHTDAKLRTALELGSPPDFEGAMCKEPGCGRRYGLQWDHVDPVAHDGPTAL